MNWTHLAKPITVCALLLATWRYSGAVTLSGTDTYMGILYSATVTHVSGSLYDVGFTIDTTGYTGSQNAWLDWTNVKISPQAPASVSNTDIPSGWSYYPGSNAGKVEFQSASVGGPGVPPDATDIAIPVSGTRPVIYFKYQADLQGTSLKTDKWSYQARYIFDDGKKYTQTIVSRDMQPQAIPEPTSVFLFGAGLLIPLATRLRRR